MDPDRDVLRVKRIAVHDGDVVLLVAVVPERHDVEVAEARREVGDGRDLHAYAVGSDAGALVVTTRLEELVEAEMP